MKYNGNSHAMTSEASADQPRENYTPTPREAEALAALKAAREAKKPSMRLRVKKTEGGAPRIHVDHEDQDTGCALLMAALGTTDSDFVNCLMGQLAYASVKDGQVSEVETNFLLSVVKGIEPRDQIESMLAAQMAAVHLAAISFANKLANASTLEYRNSACGSFNKLTRTYVTQMEALKRYRSNGEQRVIVERVQVAPGGQAIVGAIDTGRVGVASAAVLPAPTEKPLPPEGVRGQREKMRVIS